MSFPLPSDLLENHFNSSQRDIDGFCSAALQLGTKCGYLDERCSTSGINRRYFSLFGNLLFCFRNEEPTSYLGFIFTEKCELDILPQELLALDGNQWKEMFPFALTTFTESKRCIFYALSDGDRQLWVEAIENSKFLNILSRPEGVKSRTHLQCSDCEVGEMEIVNSDLASRVQLLENALRVSTDRLEESEKERLQLLRASGVVPKTSPLWTKDNNAVAKIWVGTWNMGATEPLLVHGSPVRPEGNHGRRPVSFADLYPFVPPDADIYCLGVQECVSESFFDQMDSALAVYGVRRIRLDSKFGGETAKYHSKAADGAAIGSDFLMEDISSDPSKLCGRGDGSLLSLKYTGIAVFVHERLFPLTRVMAVTRRPFSAIHSKGGVAAVLSIAGKTVVFTTCHLEAHKFDVRRAQFRDLTKSLGAQLAEPGFQLINQFHHVIWCGDLNYRLVDPESNSPLSADTAVLMLQEGRNRELFDSYDQLNVEKSAQEIFYGYREPEPFPNFFPTYKKIENRPPVLFSDPSWVTQTYRVKYKEPFYKGGRVQERTPGFCDRILYYSIADLAESLVPDRVEVELSVTTADAKKLSADDSPSLVHMVDNYQAVNSGAPWSISDHSPVFALFKLRLYGDDVADQPLPTGAVSSSSKSESECSTHNAFLSSSAGNESSDLTKSDPGMEGCLETRDVAAPVTDNRFPSNSLPFATPPNLLPAGMVFRVTLSDCKVVWGGAEDLPHRLGVLFPLPYEVINGSNFADFQSNDRLSLVSTTRLSGGQSLSTSSSVDDGNAIKALDSFASEAGESAPGNIRRRPLGWQSVSTATHSCLNLTYDSDVASLSGKYGIDPLELIWRGDAPVHSLHIALKVSVRAAAISREGEKEAAEGMEGHCAIDLNRLCRTAASSSDGVSGRVSVARQLLRDGTPMYNIDPETMQRELVTFYCNMEIAPHFDGK